MSTLRVVPDDDQSWTRGGQMVQHVGCWMLLALANEFGLHDDAEHAFKSQDGLRMRSTP
jgi:hypothetical protein